MIMRLSEVIEQTHEDDIVSDKAADNEGVWESINGHCILIKTQKLIDPQLCLVNIILRSLVDFSAVWWFPKRSYFELTVIVIAKSILSS